MISDHISYNIPPQIFEYGYPNFYVLLRFFLKLERCKPHKVTCHPIKCDVIKDVKLFSILTQIFNIIQSDVALQKQVHWNMIYTNELK